MLFFFYWIGCYCNIFTVGSYLFTKIYPTQPQKPTWVEHQLSPLPPSMTVHFVTPLFSLTRDILTILAALKASEIEVIVDSVKK